MTRSTFVRRQRSNSVVDRQKGVIRRVTPFSHRQRTRLTCLPSTRPYEPLTQCRRSCRPHVNAQRSTGPTHGPLLTDHSATNAVHHRLHAAANCWGPAPRRRTVRFRFICHPDSVRYRRGFITSTLRIHVTYSDERLTCTNDLYCTAETQNKYYICVLLRL
jgi:hypothetical protein